MIFCHGQALFLNEYFLFGMVLVSNESINVVKSISILEVLFK